FVSISGALQGGIIGLCGSQLIFPARIAKEFRYGLTPVLYALRHYNEGIINTFIKHERNPKLLAGKRMQLENSLQASKSHYPGWVYEVGFNPGVREGYRFFLINIELLTESVFALANLAAQQTDSTIINVLVPSIKQAVQKNNELINV